MTTKSCADHSADTKRPSFDCLVLDIEFGGMSGIDLATRLVADECPTSFIHLTALDESIARASAGVSGAAAYSRKTDSGADVVTVSKLASFGTFVPAIK